MFVTHGRQYHMMSVRIASKNKVKSSPKEHKKDTLETHTKYS
uniref:Uncharacterized protein n=1 Tax=Octopus bimaculoides TaxID=37653 RepID=A0A0L8HYS7_OCTBM